MTLDTQQQTTPSPEQAEPAADALAIESEAPLLDEAGDEGGEQTAEAAAPDPVASVRADLDRALARSTELEQKLTETQAAQRRLANVQAAAHRNQLIRINADYEAAKRQATANGDLERYDALNEQQTRALRDYETSMKVDDETPAQAGAQPKQDAPPPTMAPEVQKAVASFTQRHASWWNTDQKLTEAAINLHGTLQKTRPDLTIEQNLAIVELQLAIAHPDKFKKPAPAAQLQGGSRMAGASQPRGKGWADIPAEHRKQGERQIHLFLPDGVKRNAATERDIAAARAEYAKEYWSADQ